MTPGDRGAGAAAGATSGWHASLALGFDNSEGTRTVLTRREHSGPLRVQKALYPEGDAVCHAVIVHPPGGIAGGDQLDINLRVGDGARALITTPGAGKWYRSRGSDCAPATQNVRIYVGNRASLEWLPQERIVFDRADAASETRIDLAPQACYVGWEILCFGRTASGERFDAGCYRQRSQVYRDGRLAWNERGAMAGGSALLISPIGLGGQPVCATLLAVAPEVTQTLVESARAAISGLDCAPRVALSRLPHMIVARYIGPSGEEAKRAFIEIWRILRPALLGRTAALPRLWST